MFPHTAGLQRISEALNKLGNPQNDFKAVHIAGTNGKGSVCAMITAILRESGMRVGSFTSPYIVNFRERIQINGEYIPESDLVTLAQKVKNTSVPLTEFEFITALGFLWFSKQKIDIAVVETGLGGRLDATNTLPSPSVSVITKIGLDHTAVLGDTIELIAEEKCGIIKQGSVVTVNTQPQDALKVIKQHAPEVIVPESASVISSNIFGNRFIYKDQEYETTLAGCFQIENALAAIEAVKHCGLNIPQSAVLAGLRNAFIPARAEVVSYRPLIVLDGAHNPDGAEVIRELMSAHTDITAIIGVMQDKNYEQLLYKTLPLCKNVVCVSVSGNPRSLSANELSRVAQMYCKNVFTVEGYSQAIDKARCLAGENSIFIFGSLYLASAIRPLLLENDN